MARTEIPVQSFTGAAAGIAPVAPVAGDVVNGNVISDYGDTMMVRVVNTSGTTAYNFVLATPFTVRGRAIADDTTLVPISSERWFGPFDRGLYGDDLQINVDNVALTLSAFQVVV